jgi:hypothetical protein
MASRANDLLISNDDNKDLQLKVSFNYKDHSMVKQLRPFVGQIINDMREHV